MKVLVTGAGGFLGKSLVVRLLEHGAADIRCLVRRLEQATDLQALAQRHGDGAQIECLVGDLRSPDDCRAALDGVGTVYHLASGMTGSVSDMTLNSVVGSRNLLDEIEKNAGCRVVLVSSFSVYGTAALPRGAVVDETTPLEPSPVRRDAYAFTKLRQEKLFREYQSRAGFPLVVMRPGVVYGPGGGAFSSRVGLYLGGLFLHLGGKNVVPFTYVDNCAEALVAAGTSDSSPGNSYNVVDDDLLTSREYLKAYRRSVRRIAFVPVPYPVMWCLSAFVEWYHRWSKGQLPAIFTRYKTASQLKGNQFTNARLKTLGWRQIVSTREGLEATFAHLRSES